jgi:hypothetical protein
MLAIWVGISIGVLNFAGWIAFGFSLTPVLIASLLLGVLGFLLVRLSWWLARIWNPGQDIRWWGVSASLPVILQEKTNGATTSYLCGLNLVSTADNSGARTCFLQDSLGSTSGLADVAGNVTDMYTYDVFGASRSETGGQALRDYRGEPRSFHWWYTRQ